MPRKTHLHQDCIQKNLAGFSRTARWSSSGPISTGRRRRAHPRAAGRLRHGRARRAAAAPGIARAGGAGLRVAGTERVAVHARRADGRRKTARWTWSARQHHDWQRDDFPAGYYSPEAPAPVVDGARTLILTHTAHLVNAKVSRAAARRRSADRSRARQATSPGSGGPASTPTNSVSPPTARDAIRTGDQRSIARAGQLRLASHQRGDVCRAEPLVRRRRCSASRRDNVHHQQPPGQRASPSSPATAAIVWRLGPDYRADEALRKRSARSSDSTIRTSSPWACPVPAICSCSTTAARPATGFANPAAPDGRNVVRARQLTRARDRPGHV